MKKNNGRRRQRGQNRRNINNINRNTVLDSTGPVSHVRGNTFQLIEKYNSLASDATANDDKVLSESYLQFADHYYRLNKEIEALAEAKILENEKNNNGNENVLNNEKTEMKDQDVSVNESNKPSRRDRSFIAKQNEEKKEVKTQTKIPKKFIQENL